MANSVNTIAVDALAPCIVFRRLMQASILTVKATCPIGQVRMKIYLSCMKWDLSSQLHICYYLPDYWPVLSDKCHKYTTCPRSNFSKFLPVQDGWTKLKVEPCNDTEEVGYTLDLVIRTWLDIVVRMGCRYQVTYIISTVHKLDIKKSVVMIHLYSCTEFPYFHNKISYTDVMVSLYWNCPKLYCWCIVLMYFHIYR